MHKPRCLIILATAFLLLLSILRPSHSQESDLEKARVLMQQAEKLYQQGRYADALPITEKVLAIRERALGPKHSDVATSLNNLAGIYQLLADYAKAEALYKKALTIYEKAVGAEHPHVATSLNNLAMLYLSLGNYAKAESLYKRVLAIDEKILGPEHPDVARTLHNLAALYRSVGDYAKAEPLYKRSLEIMKKALGPEHPDVATSLNGLAVFYASLGDYTKAEPLYKKALTIYEKAVGAEHPHVATSLNNLAMLYLSLGNYAKAESLYKRALAINENAFGLEHPNVATNLNNLAGLYDSLGDYAKVVPLLKRAFEITEKALGPKHPGVAISLHNLAGIYQLLADYAKAEALYKRALAINENAFGPEHPNVATNLNSLAGVYYVLGDYTKAVSLHGRALAIAQKALGRDHPDVATYLSNVAGLYCDIGDYDRAELLYKEALTIYEKAVGAEHPHVAISLNNLATVYHLLADYAKTEALYKRALSINEKAFGPKHPDVATSLNNLALIYAAMNDFEKAHILFTREQEIDTDFIDQVMGLTSEDQKIKFLSTRVCSLYTFLSLINEHLSQSQSARKDALDVWLKRKGVILEAQKRFQEALIYSDNPQAMQTFQELSRVRAQLSKLTFSGPEKEGLKVHKKRLADLEVEKERLEAKLSRLSQAFALKQKIAKADCEKVAKALPGNTALIEFARFEVYNFKAKVKEPRWLPAHYLAFVLHAGNGDKVGMIDLGDAEEIDTAVAKLKKEISTMGDKATKSSKKIYDLVFEPLRNELGDVKEIFISPDGVLNLIPFEVLQGPDGRYLIEDFTFNYLGSGRDVVGFGQSIGKGKGALLMGDPDFDLDPDKKRLTVSKMALKDGEQEKITRRSVDMRGFHFTRLPGSRQEVKAIQKHLGISIKSETYLGSEALEEVLKQKIAPRILHLATHGFFLKDLELDKLPPDPTTIDRGFSLMTMPVKQKGTKVRIENPMLRSGFALAGANKSLSIKDEHADDGIVTSEEILGLRLRGTDMVVLSACDTGLGKVKTGEGVFGLRRAFAQAGAKSLIMSLWAVPDKETRELMVEFYENIMAGKMNRCQALRQAALRQMKIVKKRYGYANPYFWGGFVMAGDPG